MTYFSGHMHFKGNFDNGQNSSKYREVAPLRHIVLLRVVKYMYIYILRCFTVSQSARKIYEKLSKLEILEQSVRLLKHM